MRARPLSPHITVYRWQWPMVYSILHRATGIVLCGGVVLITAWMVALRTGGAFFSALHWITTSWFGYVCLFCLTLATFFHLFNGVRHIVWDFGLGLDLVTARLTGHLCAAAAVLASLLLWIVVVLP